MNENVVSTYPKRHQGASLREHKIHEADKPHLVLGHGASHAGKGIDDRGHHSLDRGQHRPGHHGSIGGSRGGSFLGEKPTDGRRKVRQKAPSRNAIGDGNVGAGQTPVTARRN